MGGSDIFLLMDAQGEVTVVVNDWPTRLLLSVPIAIGAGLWSWLVIGAWLPALAMSALTLALMVVVTRQALVDGASHEARQTVDTR
jgi:hypothetical protein